ncbi:CLUMA_CG020934, isoform A [Clunio marinus]|uniref:CLUMA_CG020934, isoform A n=1 Tax=Clunio marinus TaxID=568069 RepID=A0A1J1J6X9_9DIPT|nr:CLUMA_CG020934, isoform A [Clunio marinus]
MASLWFVRPIILIVFLRENSLIDVDYSNSQLLAFFFKQDGLGIVKVTVSAEIAEQVTKYKNESLTLPQCLMSLCVNHHSIKFKLNLYFSGKFLKDEFNYLGLFNDKWQQ